MEYNGLAHQIFYRLYVSSNETFRDFDYEGISYIFCQSKSEVGVVRPVTDLHVRVTDLERTIIDCINRIDLSGGLEELVQCFAIITYVNEHKLLDYLKCFDKQFLYQKTGFIRDPLEKIFRLCDVLRFLNTHSTTRECLALKRSSNVLRQEICTT